MSEGRDGAVLPELRGPESDLGRVLWIVRRPVAAARKYRQSLGPNTGRCHRAARLRPVARRYSGHLLLNLGGHAVLVGQTGAREAQGRLVGDQGSGETRFHSVASKRVSVGTGRLAADLRRSWRIRL